MKLLIPNFSGDMLCTMILAERGTRPSEQDAVGGLNTPDSHRPEYYEPVVDVYETAMTLRQMSLRGPEELSDRDLFKAFADSFATIGTHRQLEAKLHGMDHIGWQEQDPIVIDTAYGRAALHYARIEEGEVAEIASMKMAGETTVLSRKRNGEIEKEKSVVTSEKMKEEMIDSLLGQMFMLARSEVFESRVNE